MTLTEAIALLDAAQTVLSSAVKLAQQARGALSTQDQAALDAQLEQIRTRNEAGFARIDAELARAAQPPA